MTTWLELKHGDVLIDRDIIGRNADFAVILILTPLERVDPWWVKYVSLVTGQWVEERMINPTRRVEDEWYIERVCR